MNISLECCVSGGSNVWLALYILVPCIEKIVSRLWSRSGTSLWLRTEPKSRAWTRMHTVVETVSPYHLHFHTTCWYVCALCSTAFKFPAADHIGTRAKKSSTSNISDFTRQQQIANTSHGSRRRRQIHCTLPNDTTGAVMSLVIRMFVHSQDNLSYAHQTRHPRSFYSGMYHTLQNTTYGFVL